MPGETGLQPESGSLEDTLEVFQRFNKAEDAEEFRELAREKIQEGSTPYLRRLVDSFEKGLRATHSNVQALTEFFEVDCSA